MLLLFRRGGLVPGRTDCLPTVDEIVQVLQFHGTAVRVAPFKSGSIFHPLNDYWIGRLGIWMARDGSLYTGDRGRGSARPGWWGRFRLRRALRQFEQTRVVELMVEP